MRYIRCLRCDLQLGLGRNWKHLVLLGIFVLVNCMVFCYRPFDFRPNEPLNLSDYLFYIYGGMGKYAPSPDEPFLFPGLWMFLHAYLLYLCLRYPREEMYDVGQQICIRSGSRVRYWLSKCTMLFVENLCYYGMIIEITAVWTLATGGSLTEEPKGLWMEVFGRFLVGTDGEIIVELWRYLLPFVMMLFLSVFQLVLSLVIGHVRSYFILLGILLASAYFYIPFLPGNTGMLYRSGEVSMFENMSGKMMLAGTLVQWILSCIIGGVLFSRMDLLKKEEVE